MVTSYYDLEPTTQISFTLFALWNNNSNLNLRIWLFHCHIEWHVVSGLVSTLIEAPDVLQQSLSIPADHLKVCSDQSIQTTGNAAGNTEDYYDLSGQNLPPGPLPAGFTARGIVALVFSCISAFLGVAVIAW